jgi:hypothetical protein
MVSAESGGRLITWEVSTSKLIYLVSQAEGEIQQIFAHSNNKQFFVFSRPLTGCITTCTCRLFSSDDILYQFTYRAPDGPTFYKDGILTMDESVLVVAAVADGSSSSNDLDQTAATEYYLQLFNSQNGLHLNDITLRYNSFRPFNNIVHLKADSSHQQFVALIDDEKGNIIDVNRRSGESVQSFE